MSRAGRRAALAVAAAGAGDRGIVMRRNESTPAIIRRLGPLFALAAIVVAPRAALAQRVFPTPEAAANAVVAAARADDDAAMIDVFGAKHADLIVGEARVRRDNRAKFLKAVGEYRLLRDDGNGRTTLVVGYDAWPFPIPLVKDGAGWRFDTDAGREEILNRRIGANELAAIATLRAYVEAQRQYASIARDGSGVRQFAQKVRSAPGKRDGLYWDADPSKGEEVSPVGPLMDDARGHRLGDPYNGYYFRILRRQGAAAPAGRYSYVINGRMIAGYAMVAYPADYGRSGIKTFVVNHYGVVYEKDLGASTAKLGAAMTEYNPDASWKVVEE